MKDLLNNPKVKLYGALLGLLIVINLIFALYRRLSPIHPQVISSTPPQQASNVPLDTIPTFTFDQQLDANDLKVESTPSLNWILQLKDKTLLLQHPLNFQPSTNYLLSIYHQNTKVYDYSFTTQASQTDSALIQSMKDELARDYPLGQKTPYEAPGFRLVYSSPLTLEITLKNTSLDELEAIGYARSWVSENGLDPTTHKYIIAD